MFYVCSLPVGSCWLFRDLPVVKVGQVYAVYTTRIRYIAYGSLDKSDQIRMTERLPHETELN